MKHRASALWLAPIAFVSLGYAAYLAGLRVNTTNSMPEGLWWVGSIDPASLHRGQVVTFCLPDTAGEFASVRGYIGAGDCPGNRELLLKPVAALPGDAVALGPDGVSINGRTIPESQVQTTDSAGRSVPHAASGVVEPGTVWVLAVHAPLSFDSRYFGAVPIANLRGTAFPLLVTK